MEQLRFSELLEVCEIRPGSWTEFELAIRVMSDSESDLTLGLMFE